jgi:hypothetical protein
MVVRAPVAKGGGTCIMILLNSGLEEALAASPAAEALLVEALRAWQQLGNTAGVAFALAGLADGQSWDIGSAVTAGLAAPSAR